MSEENGNRHRGLVRIIDRVRLRDAELEHRNFVLKRKFGKMTPEEFKKYCYEHPEDWDWKDYRDMYLKDKFRKMTPSQLADYHLNHPKDEDIHEYMIRFATPEYTGRVLEILEKKIPLRFLYSNDRTN